MSWGLVLAVGLGTGLGAGLRATVERFVAARRRRRGLPPAGVPWATVLVNALGSGLLGLLTGAFAAGALDAGWFAVLGAGVCGGLTTFSTLALDVVELLHARRGARAAAYLAAQVVLGLGLFLLGLAVGA